MKARGFVLIVALVLGLTLATLFLLRPKIMGTYNQQIDRQILEAQAFYLARSALRYAQNYSQNTAIYYVDHIALGNGKQGYLEANPTETGWEIYGRAQSPQERVQLHWHWDGKVLTDKTRKRKSGGY